jgi:hypothetical protein
MQNSENPFHGGYLKLIKEEKLLFDKMKIHEKKLNKVKVNLNNIKVKIEKSRETLNKNQGKLKTEKKAWVLMETKKFINRTKSHIDELYSKQVEIKNHLGELEITGKKLKNELNFMNVKKERIEKEIALWKKTEKRKQMDKIDEEINDNLTRRK